MKLWQKIGVVIIAIPLLLILIGILFPKPSDKSKSISQRITSLFSRVSGSSEPSCGTNMQLLSYSPINLNEISTVVPLGNISPPGHILPTTHMYYRYIHTGQGSKLTNIYAPADMTITKITLSDNGSAMVPFDSYKIEFSLCREVKGYFILVTTLSDKLKTAFHEPYDRVQTSNVGTGKPDHNYEKEVSVKVSSGEIIGTGGGGPNMPDALDFGLTDTRTALPMLANPSRWPDTDQHYVCSADYYPDNIKQSIYSKFGNFDGNLVSIDQPMCGAVYQDVVGSAQGVWVSSKSTSTDLWDVPNDLALVHSNFNHKLGVFSFGNIFQQIGISNNLVYTFTPQTSGNVNLDFNNVKDGNIYCYQAANAQGQNIAVIIQLQDNNHLKIGNLNTSSCGSGPWSFSSSLDFIR